MPDHPQRSRSTSRTRRTFGSAPDLLPGWTDKEKHDFGRAYGLEAAAWYREGVTGYVLAGIMMDWCREKGGYAGAVEGMPMYHGADVDMHHRFMGIVAEVFLEMAEAEDRRASCEGMA